MADCNLPARPSPIKPWLVDRVLCEVAEEYATTVADILGRSRFKEHDMARLEAMRRVRLLQPTPSFPQIGRWFGRHHTTVLSACRELYPHLQRNLWEDVNSTRRDEADGRSLAP